MQTKGSNSLAVLGAVAIVAVVVAVVGAALYFGGIVGNNVQAKYNKATVQSKIVQRTNTAAYAQATYENFFKLCNGVLADNAKITQAEQRIAAIKEQPDDGFGQKAQALSQAQSDLNGVQAIQTDAAANYNALSQAWTTSQFKDYNLPASLDAPYNFVCS